MNLCNKGVGTVPNTRTNGVLLCGYRIFKQLERELCDVKTLKRRNDLKLIILGNFTQTDSRTPEERELMEKNLNEYLTGKKRKKKRKGFAELLTASKTARKY